MNNTKKKSKLKTKLNSALKLPNQKNRDIYNRRN